MGASLSCIIAFSTFIHPCALLIVLLVMLTCVKNDYPSYFSRDTLCGARLPAVALGLVTASLAVQLGFLLKMSYVGLVSYFLPNATMAASLSLVLLMVGTFVVLSVVDSVIRPMMDKKRKWLSLG